MVSSNTIRAIATITSIAQPIPLLAASTPTFRIEEATIDSIQSAILKGDLTSTQVVEMYLKRIKAYDGPCVSQPDGILGSFRFDRNGDIDPAAVTFMRVRDGKLVVDRAVRVRAPSE